MTERSRAWNGIVTGGSGPDSDHQWTDVWKTVHTPIIAEQGVFLDQLNELALSGLPISPVSIDTGRAFVNGLWYETDAAVAVTISTPGPNPRVARIVARADYTAQTVRIVAIAGTPAASPVPPALVQSGEPAGLWDTPLHQVHITTGGVITVFRDERSFIGAYTLSEPTDEKVHFAMELPWPELATTASAIFYPFRLTIAGSYNANPGPGGDMATSLRVTGGSAGDAALSIPNQRPDLINSHTIFRAKSPNTAATLDSGLGYVSSEATLTPTNGVWFRRDGNGGVTNWEAVTRSGNVETTTDTTIAATNTYKKFEIRQVGVAVVTFLIDGVVRATHQTDIPAADLILAMQIHDGAAPAVNDYLDLSRLRIAGTRV